MTTSYHNPWSASWIQDLGGCSPTSLVCSLQSQKVHFESGLQAEVLSFPTEVEGPIFTVYSSMVIHGIHLASYDSAAKKRQLCLVRLVVFSYLLFASPVSNVLHCYLCSLNNHLQGVVRQPRLTCKNTSTGICRDNVKERVSRCEDTNAILWPDSEAGVRSPPFWKRVGELSDFIPAPRKFEFLQFVFDYLICQLWIIMFSKVVELNLSKMGLKNLN